jgi:outer membrane biosynthesis protein TonB
VRPDDPLEEFAIDPRVVALPNEPRVEPMLVAGPYLVEFDEVSLLDPGRGIYEPEEVEEFPEPPQRPRPWGFAGSFGVHVLPLAVLLCLASSVPATTGGAIAVQFVLQEAAAEAPAIEAAVPQQPPEEPTPPPPPIPEPPAPAPVIPVKPVALPQPKAQQAAMTPPPAVPKPAAPVPRPAPQSVAAAALSSRAAPIQTAVQTSRTQPLVQRVSAPVGLHATGPYLAYLVSLTRQHLDLLPASLVGGRQGRTIIAVRVLDDGTIAKTRIAASSSYPDIDARIEQMVVAVGHFPPLPESLRGQGIELDLNLNFPEVFH